LRIVVFAGVATAFCCTLSLSTGSAAVHAAMVHVGNWSQHVNAHASTFATLLRSHVRCAVATGTRAASSSSAAAFASTSSARFVAGDEITPVPTGLVVVGATYT
jgi:hypothetical protein